MFLYKPADKTGPLRKFARPYHGPFQVVEMDINTAKIRRVDKPEEDTILVAVDRLRQCPSEVPDTFWPPPKQRKRKETTPSQTGGGGTTFQDQSVDVPPGENTSPDSDQETPQQNESSCQAKTQGGKWANRLRRRSNRRSPEDD